MTATYAVRAQAITKCFGDVVALDDVDLEIPAGRIHGLVGPNGAGKTTLLGLLLGLAIPDSGDLEILGAPVDRMLGVPDGVAGFVDAPSLYPALTARDNLTAIAGLRGSRGPAVRERVDAVLDQVGLTDVADDRLRGFSLGMRQRLGLAAALLSEPRLLVLDEPANGLDPAGKRHVHQVLRDLAANGCAVVVSSHRMDDLAAMCSAVTILSTGRVVFSGPIGELTRDVSTMDYRLVAADPAAAARVAAGVRGLEVLAAPDPAAGDPAALVVRGPVQALDALVADLVRAGIGIRELGPLVAPLEAAFLALTAGTPERRATEPRAADRRTSEELTGAAR